MAWRGRRPNSPGCWKCGGWESCDCGYVATARLALVVELDNAATRLPAPALHDGLGLPLVRLDAWTASAPEKVSLALDCALGNVAQIAGTFAA